jgi:tetratricopeptide (TPR) repeat protein/class 3 adenylate cyclase
MGAMPSREPERDSLVHTPPLAGRISLIFTDIEDSTRMTNALGDKIYSESIREPHCQRIRTAIGAHGGYEVKTIGDSFMISFQHADDALACAAAIQKSLTEPAITCEDRSGKMWIVKVRIGVHTAERELYPDEKGDYGGADVNFAARVESLGAGGQIIVSDSTYRVASSRERYQWQEWRDRRIKSFDQPETVWELLWDGQFRGEPGLRWVPEWFMGEHNHYIQRRALENQILSTFGKRQPDGSTPRLVTLHGYGGMGKTRLAVATAVQAVSLFKDGMFFVRLDDKPARKEALAEAIGRAFGLIGAAALPDNLLAALRDKETLLILDNYESVDSDEVAGYLADLLTQTHVLRLLVTGREAVKLSAIEQLVTLDEGMTEEEAEQLFIARAQLKRGQNWQPAASEQDHLKRILTLTERNPLAIELAAAWTDKRTLKEIADGIEATPLISGPDRPLVDRHRSLTRCLDWSFDLLEDWAQEGFARLGVFADTFTVETTTAVCDLANAQELLDRLQDAALIRRLEVNEHSRYTMHRPTRAYVGDKLDGLPSALSIRQEFVAFFRQLVVDYGGLMPQLTQAKLPLLNAEWRNAVAAAETAEVLKDWGAVGYISVYLGDYLLLRGMWSERERLNQRALAAARTVNDRQNEGGALNNLGIVYRAQGRWAQAEACYRQSLAIYREFGNHIGEGQTINNLGMVYHDQGRWDEAEGCYQQSLEINRKFGDRVSEGVILNNLGIVYLQQNQWGEAEACYQQSLEIKRELGDRIGEGQTLNNLGNVYRQQGRLGKAEACYQQSLATCGEFGDRIGEGQILNNLGIVYQRQGQLGKAEACYQQSLAICREFGDRIGEGTITHNFALLREAQGNIAGALELARQAVAVLEKTEDKAELEKARVLVAKWEQQEAQR